MIPTVGRIIHVHNPELAADCRAAIVAGIDHRPPTIHASVFSPFNPGAPVYVAVVDASNTDRWHDPRECPNVAVIVETDADPVVPHGDA